MQFHILTLFPEVIDAYARASIVGRAQDTGAIVVRAHDIRQWTSDTHHTVDDTPYGGGPGMVLKVEPLYSGVSAVRNQLGDAALNSRVVLMSTRGTRLNDAVAKRLSSYDALIIICGHYEGVDERVAEYIADEELSIGDFIVSGGELPALVVMDSVARKIPGVLGKQGSLEEIKGSYPVYTRPESFTPVEGGDAWEVPTVLTSGNHKQIEEWRREHGTIKEDISYIVDNEYGRP